MPGVPREVAPPIRFSSPGLTKTILRLGLARADQIETLAKEQGNQKILAALAANDVLDEQLSLSKIGLEVPVEVVDLSALSELPACPETVDRSFAVRHRCFPLGLENGSYIFALADPLDLETISELEFRVQAPIRIVLALESEIIRAISDFIEDDAPDFDTMESPGHQETRAVELVVSEPMGRLDGEKSNEPPPPPIVRLVNKLLSDAVQANASDVHAVPTAGALEVRFRVDGIMRDHLAIPKRLQQYVISRLKLMAEMDITERRRPQDGRFRMRTGGEVTRDVRVSSVPTPFGETIVLRLLRPDMEGVGFDTLGMPARTQQAFEEMLRGTDRIIIVTGPTSSGKTTTLYAALSSLKTGTTNIVTVEDPIEFRMDGITQIQVDTKVGVTFASGLRSILRQDPDVILVGEIRDSETAEIALRAAQTGHLVLSSLHTNTAPSAIVRLVDLGVERFMIASSLAGVLAQRLVRKVCPSCRRQLTDEEKRKTSQTTKVLLEGMRIGAGCRDCDQTGYKGRIGIFSLLPMDDVIRDLIRRNASEQEIAAAGKARGMVELYEAGMRLVEDGTTTLSEVERVVGLTSENQRQESSQSMTSSSKERVRVFSNGNEGKGTPVRGWEQSEKSWRTTESKTKFGIHTVNSKAGASTTTPVQVLLLDGDPTTRRALSRLLTNERLTIAEASSFADAIKCVRERSPRVIVCDVSFPGEEQGKTALAGLQEQIPNTSIPILALKAEHDVIPEREERLAAAVMSKSVSPTFFISRVKQLLQKT